MFDVLQGVGRGFTAPDSLLECPAPCYEKNGGGIQLTREAVGIQLINGRSACQYLGDCEICFVLTDIFRTDLYLAHPLYSDHN